MLKSCFNPPKNDVFDRQFIQTWWNFLSSLELIWTYLICHSQWACRACEWGTRNGFSSLFAQKKNVWNPYFWQMVTEIIRFKQDVIRCQQLFNLLICDFLLVFVICWPICWFPDLIIRNLEHKVIFVHLTIMHLMEMDEIGLFCALYLIMSSVRAISWIRFSLHCSYLEELDNNPDIDCNETLGESHVYSELFQKAYLVTLLFVLVIDFDTWIWPFCSFERLFLQ